VIIGHSILDINMVEYSFRYHSHRGNTTCLHPNRCWKMTCPIWWQLQSFCTMRCLCRSLRWLLWHWKLNRIPIDYENMEGHIPIFDNAVASRSFMVTTKILTRMSPPPSLPLCSSSLTSPTSFSQYLLMCLYLLVLTIKDTIGMLATECKLFVDPLNVWGYANGDIEISMDT